MRNFDVLIFRCAGLLINRSAQLHMGTSFRKLWMAALVFLALPSTAQNLIPNPGFESITACPTYANNAYYWGPDLLRYAPPWRRACWSADLLHDCSFDDYAGPEAPRTGHGKAGMMVWNGTVPNFREYAQVQLAAPLKPGVQYRFSMYVSLADDCMHALNELGVKFFTAYVNDTSACNDLNGAAPDIALRSPQGALVQKNGWTYVEGFYTAAGGENFLAIGNYFTDVQTGHVNTGSGTRNDSYYYIDDTELDSVGFTDLFMPNVFTPDGDGINDVLAAPSLDQPQTYELKIFDRWGRLVNSSGENPPAWNGTDRSGKPVNDGVYYYLLTLTETNGHPFQKKGFVELVRGPQ